MRNLAFIAATLGFSLLAAPAQAAFFEFSYSGQVINDPGDNAMILQPDGSYQPYSGPATTYPLKKGDTVTFSFSTLLPDYAGGPVNSLPPDPDGDGIYAFRGINTSGPGPNDISIQVDPSTPLRASTDPNSARNLSATIYYNSNAGVADADRFSISANSFAALSGPHYSYDPATNQLSLASQLACNQNISAATCSEATFRGNDLTIGGIHIFDLTGPNGFPNQIGFADGIKISGSWSIPIFNPNPSQVPAPPALLLFGLAAGVLTWRRRKAVASA